MKLFTVAIGKQYENEAQRLQRSINLPIEVFTKNHSKYNLVNNDNLIDGLYHKSNFANYIEITSEPILFLDADIFTLKQNPFEDFSIKSDTDFAYVPYKGKYYFPDNLRQSSFDFHQHKINSGFMYFRNLEIAKNICNDWNIELMKNTDLIQYQYDEYPLMISLMNKNYKIELLDSKWNNWELSELHEFSNSDSIFFQSHNFLNII